MNYVTLRLAYKPRGYERKFAFKVKFMLAPTYRDW